MSLLDEILAWENLRTAWDAVARNNGTAGADKVTIADYWRYWGANLHDLSSAVRDRRYQPEPLLPIVVPKRIGGTRTLRIPTVGDRVLQRAALYHADKYGRPALALDLMEEFRSVIVDSVVLSVLSRNMIASEDFVKGSDGGLYLEPAALRIFFRRYSARLQQTVRVVGIDHALSYQKLLEVQARKVRKVIEGDSCAYEPFLTR